MLLLQIIEHLMPVGLAVLAATHVNPVTPFGVVLKDELVEIGVVF